MALSGGTDRAGYFVRQPGGFAAFVPAAFPPDDLVLDRDRMRLLTETHAAIGRLAGASGFVVRPDLLVAMYVRREAVLSSQIEGTQASLDDIFQFEVAPDGVERPRDVEEVIQYIKAYRFATQRIESLPLSLRLLREVHAVLLNSARGRERQPGDVRSSQNWIGGTSPATAAYVPPPVHEMHAALNKWERFVNAAGWDPIIQSALAHAQFETIHPFLDGNGRLGRLLIPLMLQERGVIDRERALLYPSHVLKLNQQEYYARLQRTRTDGDWEGWLQFYMDCLRQVALETYLAIREIDGLRSADENQLPTGRGSGTLRRALESLFAQPVVTASSLAGELGVSTVTAHAVVRALVDGGILVQIRGGERNRVFAYQRYLDLFSDAAVERRLSEVNQAAGTTRGRLS